MNNRLYKSRGELSLATLLLITSLLTFGYTTSRVVYEHSLADEMDQRTAELDRLARQARNYAKNPEFRSTAAFRQNDPSVSTALESLAQFYEREAARSRADARNGENSVRDRARPDPVRFLIGQQTGLPLDDIVFIAGDYQAAYGDRPAAPGRSPVLRSTALPSTIRERILMVAAGARLRDAYQEIIREEPGKSRLPMNHPDMLYLVRNRARKDILDRYLNGGDEHLDALNSLVELINRDQEPEPGIVKAPVKKPRISPPPVKKPLIKTPRYLKGEVNIGLPAMAGGAAVIRSYKSNLNLKVTLDTLTGTASAQVLGSGSGTLVIDRKKTEAFSAKVTGTLAGSLERTSGTVQCKGTIRQSGFSGRTSYSSDLDAVLKGRLNGKVLSGTVTIDGESLKYEITLTGSGQ